MGVAAQPSRKMRLLFLLCIILLCTLQHPLHAQTNASADIERDDDAALRQLATRFYHSLESGNQASFLELWSSQSPNNEWQSFARKYVPYKVQRFEVLSIKIQGDHAKVNVHAEIEPLAQPEWPKVPSFIGWQSRQTLRCVQDGSQWKVLEQLNTVEDLVDDLVDAPDRANRLKLLDEHPELVSNELMLSLYPERIELMSNYDFDKAVELYHLAIEIETRLGQKTQIADLLNALAIQFGSRGDQNQELQYYLKSLEVSEQLPENERRSGTYVYANLGTIYSAQGKYSQALEWFNRGLNPVRPQCWVLRNIANAYKGMEDYSKALESFNKCLSMAHEMKPESGRDGEIAGAYAGIGDVYLAQSKFAQALESYQKALDIIELPQNSYARGLLHGILNSIAKTYLQLGNPGRASEFIERALATPRPQSLGPAGDLEILPTAGRIYRELGLAARSRELLDQAIAGSEYRRSHAAGGEQNRQQYFEQLITPYHEMIKLLISDKQSEEAFTYAERSKARALLDVLDNGRAEINKYLTADERARDLALRQKIATLNVAIQSAKQDPDPSRLNALEVSLEETRREYESFQTNLYAVHPELRGARGELKPLTLSETETFFSNPRTALIEFVVTDEKTYLFVITKESVQRPSLSTYEIKIDGKELTRRVDLYREKLAKRDPDFVQTASELFSLLLGPATRNLTDKSSLIIVPDGVLWNLPFQALKSDRNRFLIEDYSISYAPSFTALREMSKGNVIARKGSASTLDLLALGNPVNGTKVKERMKTGLMDYAFEPLPEAEKQVLALARLYGPTKSKVYIGTGATEENAKANAPKSRIIQFATHGLLDSRNPMYSQLVLSEGAKDGNEDGLLEAWEIMKLDLHADLVVLAACETARGRVGAGEGMIGMSWAFFVAGSPTTVASQWKVESASTTELMLAFHHNLMANRQGERMSKARALQLAALQLLKTPRYKHPFYWAAFVLLGDGS